MNYVYDSETFVNCYQICFHCVETREKIGFEISSRIDETLAMRAFILDRKRKQDTMIGFNNVGFDYPVLHYILVGGIRNPTLIYQKAMEIINSENKFGSTVKPSDCWVEQIDLFKIHHFDNKARTTSLKALEFNMRLDNISDLPFPVGTMLSHTEMNVLWEYCWNDVEATFKFYEQSLEQIEFRRKLSLKHGFSFMNFSDVKIGKEIFTQSLQSSGVACYNYDPESGRTPKQTLRTEIVLAECIPPYIRFESPEFNEILDFFKKTIVSTTKGALGDLTATVKGLEFKFGTGGLHASVENETFMADDDMMIYDIDVTSLYPSIAIENGYYPEHLGPKFVEVYRQLRSDRVKYPKGTPENAMLKLALNGVYGASNDPYSVFYDPLFTMKITIGGQLMLAMLAEQLLSVQQVKIIQVNTDGITLYFPRKLKWLVDGICYFWEQLTKLNLEHVEYFKMVIADVNSYAAMKNDGSIKRKGRYEYDLEWHQNASALVVPMVAEKVLFEGVSISETVRNWSNTMDFMLRVKVPRSSKLMIVRNGKEQQLENTQRYYMSHDGGELVKVMPPLAKKPDVYRRIAVNSGYKVQPCNNIAHAVPPINYDWYISRVEDLVYGVL